MTALLAPRPRVDRTFERLYRRHATDVYRYALGVMRNQADAEDVTQTTFLNAFRALERGEQPLAPHNWLIAIAHNVCRQRFRAAARRPREVELHDVAEQLVLDDDVPSPEDLKRALGHLGFNQRAAIVMREIEGRSYADIAEVLGLSISAVETLIFRARRALREQLEGSLTCDEAELAISRQLDGRLSRAEKGQLRAHVRQCADCATLARRQRAQRSALRSLGAVPLPPSLAGLFGGGGAAGVAVKVAAVVVAASAAGGAGYGLHHSLAVRSPAGKKPSRVAHAAKAPPAQRTAWRLSLPALGLDRPPHATAAAAAAAAVAPAHARSHRHAGARGLARGRARGLTGLPSAASSAHSRSNSHAAARASRGRPSWSYAHAAPSSHAAGTAQTHRARPAATSSGASRGNGAWRAHSVSVPPESHSRSGSTNGSSNRSSNGSSNGQGNGASISSQRRPHS